MDVSIIFVNYNTISLLTDAIDSALEKTIGVIYEIIVVDNASNDNSRKILSDKYQSNVIYIALPENIGFGRANNEGMKIAKGRNVFLLNPDTILQNNAVKILSDYLDQNEGVGVVGANLYNEDGSAQPCFCHYYPSIGYELSNLFHLLFLYNREVFNYTEVPKKVSRVVGAAMMIKKGVINKTGMFDARFFMYAEEDEWCFRISKSGYTIFNLPQAKITHLDGKSFQFSAERQKRKLEGLRTFYRVSYSSFYCKMLRLVEYLTIMSRLIISKMSNNIEKLNYWKFMYNNRDWK
jgi:GT2 family glycosyltransferase